jgi:hypothetical protein
MLHLKHACSYLKRHKFTHDERRNIRLGGIVSLYGIAFATEKLLNVIGYPLSDMLWMLIYGGFALISTYWWAEDFVLDLWEKYTTEDDELYGTNSKK